jgi:hypothetical protein
LVPFTRQPPSPVLVARHWTRATSEPESGSVTATATSFSPDAIAGSSERFCSSLPALSRARIRI